MKSPPLLRSRDRVAIIATARKITFDELKPAIDILQSWELDVVLGENIFNIKDQFAGEDNERINDLQWALDDENIKAVFCARGGYGTVKIIDSIDFSKFKQQPKWIIGYSDITVLHSHILQNFEIETLHAIMPLNFPKKFDEKKYSLLSLKSALFNKLPAYKIKPHFLNKKGKANGELVGGNLSVLYSLLSSESDINTEGKILFIEDLDEYLYHIDRMMMALKRSRKFKFINGLIVGSMSDMKDNIVPYGKTAEEIIFDIVKDYSFPVCFNFPSGHSGENNALIMGRNVELIVDENVELRFNENKNSKISFKYYFLNLKNSIFIFFIFFIFIYIILRFIHFYFK